MLRYALALSGLLLASAGASRAEDAGLITTASAHSPRVTLERFGAQVRAAGWIVFAEIDHAAAARDAGLALPSRSVLLFGNPRAGTPAMAATPSLGLDLPMRVLVWEDELGRVFLTRSSGEDIASRIFRRHGIEIPPQDRAGTEALLAGFVARATR